MVTNPTGPNQVSAGGPDRMREVATKMLNLIREIEAADLDGSGEITAAEFQRMIQDRIEDGLRERGLARFDRDGNGTIGRSGFVQAIFDRLAERMAVRMAERRGPEAFARLDLSGNGSIAASPAAFLAEMKAAVLHVVAGNDPATVQSGPNLLAGLTSLGPAASIPAIDPSSTPQPHTSSPTVV